MINVLPLLLNDLNGMLRRFKPNLVWRVPSTEPVEYLQMFVAPADTNPKINLLSDTALTVATEEVLQRPGTIKLIAQLEPWSDMIDFPKFDGASLSPDMLFVRQTFVVLFAILYTVAERLLHLARKAATMDKLTLELNEIPTLTMEQFEGSFQTLVKNINYHLSQVQKLDLGESVSQASRDLDDFAYEHQTNIIAHALSNIPAVYNLIDEYLPVFTPHERVCDFPWPVGEMQRILDSRAYLEYANPSPASEPDLVDLIARKVLIIMKEQTWATDILTGLKEKIKYAHETNAKLRKHEALSDLLDTMQDNAALIIKALTAVLPPKRSDNERVTDYINRLNSDRALVGSLELQLYNRFAIRENWFDEFIPGDPEDHEDQAAQEALNAESSGGGSCRRARKKPGRSRVRR
jgi:hypothetical protein